VLEGLIVRRKGIKQKQYVRRRFFKQAAQALPFDLSSITTRITASTKTQLERNRAK